MLALPDRHGFRGRRTGDATRSYAGRTRFRGVIACVPMPKTAVATWLPAGLAPAAPTVAREDHPIVLVIGEQRDPAVLRGGLAMPMGPTYGELGVFVPYVRSARGELCTFALRMWSTYFPAVWEGNHRYFAKDSATMRFTPEQLVAADDAGRPLVHAVIDGGDWTPVRPGTPAGLDAIRDAFALRVLGRPASDRLAASYFDWNFDAATARPVRASIWVASALVGGGAPRELAIAPTDAVEVRDMTWRLTFPSTQDSVLA